MKTEAPLSSIELLAKLAVETGGGVFVGVEKSSRHNGVLRPALVIFKSPTQATCLSLSVTELSSFAVRKLIDKSEADAEFELLRRGASR